VNNADIVTQLPLPAMGYEHVGLALYFDHQGTLRPGLGRRAIARDRRAAFTADSYLGKLQARDREIETLWDHGAGGYVKHLYVNRGRDVDTDAARRALITDALSGRTVPTRRAKRVIGWLAGMGDEARATVLFKLPAAAMKRLVDGLPDDDPKYRALLSEWIDAAPAAAVRHASVRAALRAQSSAPM
jgi:hypothetical protein